MEQLYLLGHQQGAEFRGESFDEILIREDSGPMRSTVSIIIVPGAGSPDRYRGATCSIPGAFVSSAVGTAYIRAGSHERSGLRAPQRKIIHLAEFSEAIWGVDGHEHVEIPGSR
jgi:hypothetical protein